MCEENCTDSSGKPTKFEVRKVETTSKTGNVARKEPRPEAARVQCGLRKKFGHNDSNCWFNPTNQRGPGVKKDGEGPVGVNEVSVQKSTTTYHGNYTPGHQRPPTTKGGTSQQGSFGDRPDLCYLCCETGHRSWNCPVKVQWDQFLADKD